MMRANYLLNKLTYSRKFSSVDSGLRIGGRVKISGKGKISAGKNFWMEYGCKIDADKNALIKFGNDVHLGHDVDIGAQKLIEIGDEARIGDGSIIVDSDWHGFNGNPPKIKPVKLGFHVWLGFRVIILKGVTIGDYAIIGAGAIVASNVAANAIVVGNPAKQIGTTKSGHTI